MTSAKITMVDAFIDAKTHEVASRAAAMMDFSWHPTAGIASVIITTETIFSRLTKIDIFSWILYDV